MIIRKRDSPNFELQIENDKIKQIKFNYLLSFITDDEIHDTEFGKPSE